MSTMVEGVPVVLETEVVAKAQSRRFTVAEKLRVLRQANGRAKPGEPSALLRREGLSSAHLASWRAARQRRELAGLAPHGRRLALVARPRTTQPTPPVALAADGGHLV